MTEKKGWAETLDVIRNSGVPTYDMPETGARVLASMGRYSTLLKRPLTPPVSFPDSDSSRARSIIETAKRAGQSLLTADDGFNLLTCYGIPVARYGSAGNVDDCLAAADEIGYPVVLKVDAPTVVHKTDRGGVVLGIGDREALRAQAQGLAARFAEASPRFLIQEQLPAGREVIVGAKAAEGLGHVVMFGLGGIYVEVLKDVTFALTPVAEYEAGQMIESLKARPLLTGIRGQAGADIAALSEIIQRVSYMLVQNPEIRELDINPAFAFAHGVRAADVRVIL
jgi:acetyltransferase